MTHDAERAVADLTRTGVIGGTQKIKEALSYLVVRAACTACGCNGFRTVPIDDLSYTFADPVKGIVP